MNEQQTHRLVTQATAFWQQAESPSEDAMLALFYALAERDDDKMAALLKHHNVR